MNCVAYRKLLLSIIQKLPLMDENNYSLTRKLSYVAIPVKKNDEKNYDKAN